LKILSWRREGEKRRRLEKSEAPRFKRLLLKKRTPNEKLILAAIKEGKYEEDDLAQDAPAFKAGFIPIALKAIEEKRQSDLDNEVQDSTQQYWLNKYEDYRCASESYQRYAWTRDMNSKPATDDSGQEIAANGQIVLEGDCPTSYKAQKARAYNVELKPLQDDILSAVLGNYQDQAKDAIDSYSKLYLNHSVVLGDENSDFNMKMATALTLEESGDSSLDDIRETVSKLGLKGNKAPISLKELNENFKNDDAFDDGLMKNYFPAYDPDNDDMSDYAYNRYKKHYYYNYGNKEIAYRNAARDLARMTNPTSLNGEEVTSSTVGNPEAYASDRDLRKAAVEIAREKIRNVFAKPGAVEANQGYTIDANSLKIEKGKNSVKVGYNDGYLTFVPLRRLQGQEQRYEVRYNYVGVLGGVGKGVWYNKVAARNAGYQIFDPETGAPVTIRLSQLLGYHDERAVEESANDIRKLIDPQTNKQLIDVTLAVPNGTPAEIDRLMRYLHSA
jgi:hypothetical protein